MRLSVTVIAFNLLGSFAGIAFILRSFSARFDFYFVVAFAATLFNRENVAAFKAYINV